jgi:hypothetical protein
MTTLNAILASNYAVAVLGAGGRLPDVIAQAKLEMAADPLLFAEAQAELARLNGIRDLEKRDFAAAQHREFLSTVLNP